jgi:hypothetical protein
MKLRSPTGEGRKKDPDVALTWFTVGDDEGITSLLGFLPPIHPHPLLMLKFN